MGGWGGGALGSHTGRASTRGGGSRTVRMEAGAHHSCSRGGGPGGWGRCDGGRAGSLLVALVQTTFHALQATPRPRIGSAEARHASSSRPSAARPAPPASFPPPLPALQIRLLRSMLEWGRELGASIAAESIAGADAEGEAGLPARDAAAIAAWTEAQLALPAAQGPGGGDVCVVVWPGGRILRVPRGTTAGERHAAPGRRPRTACSAARVRRLPAAARAARQVLVMCTAGDSPPWAVCSPRQPKGLAAFVTAAAAPAALPPLPLLQARSSESWA